MTDKAMTGRQWVVENVEDKAPRFWRGNKRSFKKLYLAIAKGQPWNLKALGFELVTDEPLDPQDVTRESAPHLPRPSHPNPTNPQLTAPATANRASSLLALPRHSHPRLPHPIEPRRNST